MSINHQCQSIINVNQIVIIIILKEWCRQVVCRCPTALLDICKPTCLWFQNFYLCQPVGQKPRYFMAKIVKIFAGISLSYQEDIILSSKALSGAEPYEPKSFTPWVCIKMKRVKNECFLRFLRGATGSDGVEAVSEALLLLLPVSGPATTYVICLQPTARLLTA